MINLKLNYKKNSNKNHPNSNSPNKKINHYNNKTIINQYFFNKSKPKNNHYKSEYPNYNPYKSKSNNSKELSLLYNKIKLNSKIISKNYNLKLIN